MEEMPYFACFVDDGLLEDQDVALDERRVEPEVAHVLRSPVHLPVLQDDLSRG